MTALIIIGGVFCVLFAVGYFISYNPMGFAIRNMIFLGALAFVAFLIFIGWAAFGQPSSSPAPAQTNDKPVISGTTSGGVGWQVEYSSLQDCESSVTSMWEAYGRTHAVSDTDTVQDRMQELQQEQDQCQAEFPQQ